MKQKNDGLHITGHLDRHHIILSGGCSAWLVPDEVRKKLSVAGKGKPKSQEWRKKISDSNKGKNTPSTPEALQKLLEYSRKGALASKNYWLSISVEERSRRFSRISKDAWKSKTTEERSFFIRKMLSSRITKSTPEERKEISKRANAVNPGNKAWWDSVDPIIRKKKTDSLQLHLKESKVKWTPEWVADIQRRRREAIIKTNTEKWGHLNGPDARLCKRGHKDWAINGKHQICLTCARFTRSQKQIAREAAKVAESKQGPC